MWQLRLLIGFGALLAIVLFGGWREHAGVMKERGRWQAARAELMELRQQKADWAAGRLAAGSARVGGQLGKERERARRDWQARPDRGDVCVDADGVRAIEAARARLRAAAAGTGEPAVRGPAEPAGAADKGGGRPVDHGG